MDAIGTQLQTHLGDPVVEGLQVASRLVWNASPPTIDVYPDEEFQQGLGFGRGDNALFFTVRARVNTPDHEGAQDLLLAMMDPQDSTSVSAAITAPGTSSPAKTLGGLVENCVVVSGPSNFGVFVDPGPNAGALLGCTWRVQVIP
jgi:hypothetical protein